jgi:hypothetical protein
MITSRIKIALLIIGATVMLMRDGGVAATGSATPMRDGGVAATGSTPTRDGGVAATGSATPMRDGGVAGFTISDAEIAKISRDDMVKTLKHVLAMYKDALAVIARQNGNLANATGETTNALGMQNRSLSNMNDLQEQIQSLKKHDEEMTAKVNTLSKALWWYRLHWWGAWVMLGLGVLACIVVAFLKFTGRLAIAGAKL